MASTSSAPLVVVASPSTGHSLEDLQSRRVRPGAGDPGAEPTQVRVQAGLLVLLTCLFCFQDYQPPSCMAGLRVKVWPPAVNPADLPEGRLVVLHGVPRFAPKYAFTPGAKWTPDTLPTDSRLKGRQALGMVVSLKDLPLGRHFAVPLGKSAQGPVLWWMCPCGTRLYEHKLKWTDCE